MLLKIIFGLIRLCLGIILFEDIDIIKKFLMEIVKFGIFYVLEGRCVFFEMMVLENLEFGVFLRKDK